MLERYWYIACRSRSLRKRPLAVTIMGRRLVLFRAAARQPVACEDRCAHRNSPLSSGRVCDGMLQCPYHGWSYDDRGRLARIPALDGADLPRDVCIETFPCIEQDGYIWVSPGVDPLVAAPLELPHIQEAGWTSFRMQTRFNAPVEACLENFLDCPHAAHVHRHWFRAPIGKKVPTRVRGLEDGAEAEYFHEPREKSLVWWLLSPRSGEMKHTDRFIAPNISRVDYEFANGLHYIITSVCTPLDDRSTEVFTTISFKYRRIGPLIRLFFEPLSRIIIRQDVDMLDAMQNNIDQFGGAEFVCSDADLLAPHIRRWRQAIRNGDDLPGAQAPRDIDIHL